jgi:hypothetical protein
MPPGLIGMLNQAATFYRKFGIVLNWNVKQFDAAPGAAQNFFRNPDGGFDWFRDNFDNKRASIFFVGKTNFPYAMTRGNFTWIQEAAGDPQRPPFGVTIAHEVGHIFLGPGHPETAPINLMRDGGPVQQSLSTATLTPNQVGAIHNYGELTPFTLQAAKN